MAKTKTSVVTIEDCELLKVAVRTIADAKQSVADAETDLAALALRIRRKYELPPNAIVDYKTGVVTIPPEDV